MDRVFVSSSRGSPKKGTLKQFFTGGSGQPRSPVSDTATDYFPYAGGDGVDGHEFQPSHLSYEPAESMVESDVHIDTMEPQFSRKLKRVLLRGSKYEVYEPVPKADPANSSPNGGSVGSIPSNTTPSNTIPSALDPLHSVYGHADPATGGDPGSGDLSDLWAFQWLEQIPTSIETAIPLVRKLSQRSIILLPIDSIADHIDGVEPLVAGLEVFIMMLISDQLAKVVRIVCRPAVWLASLIVGLL